jgi:hypothetical protein
MSPASRTGRAAASPSPSLSILAIAISLRRSPSPSVRVVLRACMHTSLAFLPAYRSISCKRLSAPVTRVSVFSARLLACRWSLLRPYASIAGTLLGVRAGASAAG